VTRGVVLAGLLPVSLAALIGYMLYRAKTRTHPVALADIAV